MQLAAQTLQAIRTRNELDTTLLDDVVLGCVSPLGEQGADIARVAVLVSGYAETVPGQQLNRFCASGLEAVNNAVRHAKPTNIDISLNYDADQVSLTIKDNGCGFTTSEQATWRREGEHFGLVTMHERAEKIGGRLYVESNPGAGTTLLAVAPVTGA